MPCTGAMQAPTGCSSVFTSLGEEPPGCAKGVGAAVLPGALSGFAAPN